MHVSHYSDRHMVARVPDGGDYNKWRSADDSPEKKQETTGQQSTFSLNNDQVREPWIRR